MQTMRVLSAMQRSIALSAKKYDLPDPRPPYAPLYRAGASSGTNALGVSSFRIDNDALDTFKPHSTTIFVARVDLLLYGLAV